jgi:fatty-acyl-CoA synthase
MHWGNTMHVRLNLPNSIIHWSRYAPERTAVLGLLDRVSYRELNAWSLHVFQVLTKCSREKDHIGICVRSSPAHWAAILGAMHAGCVPVVLHPNLDEPTIRSILVDCKADTIISDRKLDRNLMEPSTRLIILGNYSEIAANCPKEIGHTIPTSLSDVWGIIYTSGTTNRPKGVVRTNLSVLFELIAWSMELPFSRGQTMYIGRPLAYVAGMMLSAAAMLVGGSVIAPETHTAETLIAYSKKTEVDCAYLFPNQIGALLEHCQKNSVSNLHCRKIVTMGAKIDPLLKIRVKQELGVDIVESWGNSEGLGTISEPRDLESRPASVGRPFVTDNVVVLREDLSICEPLEVGRICEYTDTAMSGYLTRYGLDKSMISGGLVASEDYGYLDEAGFLYLKGRLGERIRVNGKDIFTGDIERVVLQYEAVQDVKVVAIESQPRSTHLVAVVERRPNHSVDTINMLADLNEQLPSEQRIGRLVVVEALPRNVGGKIVATEVIKMCE